VIKTAAQQHFTIVKSPILIVSAIGVLYVLHQDLWFWRVARPLVFGFLPIGLAYHAFYCVAIALLMWWLATVAWPTHLEHAGDDTGRRGSAAAEGRRS
jgi:hypothetical protein